jgi:SNF2 family DNA or RNA helicase
MVACDELHRCKNINTQQGAGLLELQPYYRVGMTGTPLLNSPLDLYAILKWLGYEPYEFGQFKYHFCEFDAYGSVVGYKNINQLRDQLSGIMIRRTKDEVLDLPEKIYKNEYVELTGEQRGLYNDVIDNALASDDTDEKECVLATLLKLRQVAGGIGPYDFIKKNPKLDRLEQIIEEAVYSDTKVIVYSNWIEGIKPAIERLQKYNPVVITGETKDADRQNIVNKFQNDPTVKVILGTTGALGTGLTLTAATEVVFLDNPWNNATKEQTCDRAYRIGTTSAVTIHTIMAHGTYDENVQDIIEGKKQMSDDIVEKKDLKKLKIT